MEAIPILLFIAPSWVLSLLYFYFSLRPFFSSKRLATLNQNLRKAGLYWSNSEGNFRTLEQGNPQTDKEKAYRSFWIMTTLLSLMSIVGTGILFLIFVSGHPRLERNALESALGSNADLDKSQVEALVEELKLTC